MSLYCVMNLVQSSYCFIFSDTHYRSTRARLLSMTLALFVHDYTPWKRQGYTTCFRLALILCQLSRSRNDEIFKRSSSTMQKCVMDTEPRVSTSDTDTSLGKRKRSLESTGTDDVTDITGCSSDNKVYVYADWSRSFDIGKRRKNHKWLNCINLYWTF